MYFHSDYVVTCSFISYSPVIFDSYAHTLKTCLNIQSKCSRYRFWEFYLASLAIYIASRLMNSFIPMCLIGGVMGDSISSYCNDMNGIVINSMMIFVNFMTVYSIACLIVSRTTLSIQRLNDLEYNKWLTFLFWTPFVGEIFMALVLSRKNLYKSD